MSSLAATRSDNFYYDPERFDPKKRGRDSVNALAGSHPLGERAKRLKSEGILVIRFEMPHDCWCNKCKKHTARGVRFNADKKKVGAYFSTTIWEFSMKCPHRCGETFVIRTNPKESDYDFVSGATRRVKDPSDPTEAGMMVLESQDEEFRKRMHEEHLFAMEQKLDDKIKASRYHRELQALEEESARRHGKDRLEVLSKARGSVRDSKQRAKENEKRGEMAGFHGSLEREQPQDAIVAKDAFRQARMHDVHELVEQNPNFLLEGLDKGVRRAMGRTVFEQPLIKFVPGGTEYSSVKHPAETISFIKKKDDLPPDNSSNRLYSQFVKSSESTVSTTSTASTLATTASTESHRGPSTDSVHSSKKSDRRQEALLSEDIFSKRYTNRHSESNTRRDGSSTPGISKRPSRTTATVYPFPTGEPVSTNTRSSHMSTRGSPASSDSPRNLLIEVLEKRNTRRPAHLPPERRSVSAIVGEGLAKQKRESTALMKRLTEEKKRVANSFRVPVRPKTLSSSGTSSFSKTVSSSLSLAFPMTTRSSSTSVGSRTTDSLPSTIRLKNNRTR